MMNFAEDGWKPTPDQSVPEFPVTSKTDFSFEYMAEQRGKKRTSEHFPLDQRLDVMDLVNYWDRYVTMP